MRLIVLVILCLFAEITLAQSDGFKFQFNSVVLDATNNFKRYLGDTKVLSGNKEIIFHSTMTLDGTTDNVIYPFRSDSLGIKYPAFYSARIAKVNEKEARKKVQDWTRLIEKSLNESFSKQTFQQDFKTLGYSEGINLTGEHVDIKIYYEKPKENKECFVYFSIISKSATQ